MNAARPIRPSHRTRWSRRAAALAIACCTAFALLGTAATAQATTVRLNTDAGPIDIELLDAQAPQTVANFLNYLRRGSYDNMFFHRLVRNFVIQGGGFVAPAMTAIATDPPVVNEFSLTRSNLRGTVAMAKLGGNPNSATNQFFVNLANNSANLDNQNGGFTVFGRVTTPSMAIVDRLAALPLVSVPGQSVFSDLPVYRTPATTADLVVVTTARELPVGSAAPDHIRIFNYVEALYPQYAAPANAPVLEWEGYTYRFYSKTGAYLGVRNGEVFYLLTTLSPNIERLGSVAEWLAMAAAAGY
jgi:peptidyl-prolyl cis-trans isomerase A (cyclophilin A)